MAGEIPAKGTLIQIADMTASPVTFHTIENVGDIEGPGQSTEVLDTSSHSTGDNYAGKSPGMIDAGQLSFPVFYNPTFATHSDTSAYGLGKIFKDQTKVLFRIVGTDASSTTREFLGFVSEFSESYPVRGIQTRNTTIEIDGEIEVVTP